MDNQPSAPPPPDTLVHSDSTLYHVQQLGTQNAGPAIVFETGLTMMSACWGWLAPELSRNFQVLLYDRAGLGWSEERPGLRDSPQLAGELHELLHTLNLSPPYIFLGHSIGALINLAYYKLFPGEVASLLWLDPSHPDLLLRFPSTRRQLKNFFFLLEACQLLASRNIPGFDLPLLQQVKGLPPENYLMARMFLKNPKHLRTSCREARSWNISSNFARGVSLGDTPLLVISAQKKSMKGWNIFQAELASLSMKSRHLTFTDASHVSLLANREHALRAAMEIHGFLQRLSL